MAMPPSVQAGHVPLPAGPIVQGDSCQGVQTAITLNAATGQDYLIMKGNAAGRTVLKIF